jgi:mannose-1-phosphate guanylyltransferase
MSGFKAVVLAGGNGERFWPLSTPERPKQFLRIFGGDSLIRQSVSRLGDMVSASDVYAITSKDLVSATRHELPDLPAANIIGEPMRRDTGAAVALGVAAAGADDDTVIGFFPSDQMVSKPAKFRSVLKRAISIAKRKECIVTIGISPTYPAECFGYVNAKSGRFVEKPDVETAKKYLADGYLWNAGMFIARASVFRKAFAEYAPSLLKLASGSLSNSVLARRYRSMERISFDYAVMEPLSHSQGSVCVAVVSGDFGWDDVGSFSAFDKHFPHDS